MPSSVMEHSTGSAVRLEEGRESFPTGWMEEKGIDRAETQIGFLRFYDPNLQRWPNRDPLGDAGFLTTASGGSLSTSMLIAEGIEGANLYLFVRNIPISAMDSVGLIGFDGNGKVYGNWCGGDWTGGKHGSYNPVENYAPPIDALDSACEVHDKYYYKCRERFPCNKDSRSTCFRLCDQALTKAAYQFGGVWGKGIGKVIDRSGTRDPEPNRECCKDGGK